MQQIKLFCLPFAGGSATTYLKWKKFLDPSIELVPIELAGRGKRYSDPFYENIEQAIDDIYDELEKDWDREPYALFGHSMGSLLTYELLVRIKSKKRKMPEIVFFSGKNPPHKRTDRSLHDLPEQELISEIMLLGGTPKELLDSKELLNIYLPIIRSDFKMLETYEIPSEREPLACNIIVLNGKEDTTTTCEEMEEWEKYSSKSCDIYHYEGGHFFINDQWENITQLINNNLVNFAYT